MNRKKRSQLYQAIGHLEQAADLVTSVLDDERYCFDNMPENLEGSEAVSKMEDAIDSLEDAMESIESAKESIDKASE